MGFLSRILGRVPKPGGMIRFRDENGQVEEKRVDPHPLQRLLDQAEADGTVKEVYRILVKTVLSPVVELKFIELTSEQVAQFVVPETGTAYGFSLFDNGKPRFMLAKKELWDLIEGYSIPNDLL